MCLVFNWKRVLSRAPSVYCSAGSTLRSLACGPILDGYQPIPRIGFGVVGAPLTGI